MDLFAEVIDLTTALEAAAVDVQRLQEISRGGHDTCGHSRAPAMSELSAREESLPFEDRPYVIKTNHAKVDLGAYRP